MDPSSDVLVHAQLGITCQPSPSDIIVMMIMTSVKLKTMDHTSFWTGQTRISPCPPSPAARVLTTQLWPRALLMPEGRVSGVMGTAGTLLGGVMTSGMDIVKTPECGELIPDFVHTQPFGKT